MPNHYDTLGVARTSEPEVIEAAYKALLRKYHPDMVGENDRVRAINAAYDELRDPIKRRAYDVSLQMPAVLATDIPNRGSAGSERVPHAANPDSSKICPDCAEEVARDANLCRYCGFRFWQTQRSPEKRGSNNKVIWWVGAAALLLIVILASGGEEPEATETVASAETAECAEDAVKLDLGPVESRGTLELLARKPETDAHDQLIFELGDTNCFSRTDIDEFAKAAGWRGSVKLLVGHDPKGTINSFRNRFTYEADAATPVAEMPRPPKDMHFGEVTWDPKAQSKQLAVSWYGDFRKWQEGQYGQSEPVTAGQSPRTAPVADWTDVGVEGPYKIEMNVAGMVMSPPTATFWVKTQRRAADDQPQPFTLAKAVVNCEAQTFNTLSSIDYDANGEFIRDGDLSGAEQVIAPSTNLAIVTGPVCAAMRR